MKVTKQMLSKINDLAKYNYRNDSNSELSPEELVAQAWVKAVMGQLAKEVELEFPNRIVTESIFED